MSNLTKLLQFGYFSIEQAQWSVVQHSHQVHELEELTAGRNWTW